MEAATKRRQHTRGEKGRFGEENAELKNTALKRRDGCSTSRCMSDRNYPSLYSAIRMRIRGSETHTAGQASAVGGVGWGGGLSFMGVTCLLHAGRMSGLQRRVSETRCPFHVLLNRSPSGYQVTLALTSSAVFC